MIKILFAFITLVFAFGISGTSFSKYLSQLNDTTIIKNNGFSTSITSYHNGLKNGTEYIVVNTGDTLEINHYKLGKLDGKCLSYFWGNRLALIRYFENGYRTGEWLRYDTLGNLNSKTIFDKPYLENENWSGKIIFYEAGKQAYTQVWRNGKRSNVIIHDAALYKQIQDRERPLMGQRLFNQNCAACHSIHKDIIGPALAEPARTRSKDWFIKFTRNGHAMYKAGDTAAIRIYKRYNRIEHPSFTDLTKAEIEAIINYLKEKRF